MTSHDAILKLNDDLKLEISTEKPYKMSLVFLYDGKEDNQEYILLVYCDEKAWMKIHINVKFI